jgi:hypothetical protein
MRDEHEALAHVYFQAAFNQGVRVGQLRTRLGIEGWYREGPRAAAEALFRHVTERSEVHD